MKDKIKNEMKNEMEDETNVKNINRQKETEDESEIMKFFVFLKL